MRGKTRKPERARQRMAFVVRWPSWYRLSTRHEQRKYSVTYRIHGDEWYTGIRAFTITIPEFTYRVAVIFISATVTGLGLGQVIFKIIGG